MFLEECIKYIFDVWTNPNIKKSFTCNLALAWAAVQARPWNELDYTNFEAWRNAAHWRARYNGLFGSKSPSPTS